MDPLSLIITAVASGAAAAAKDTAGAAVKDAYAGLRALIVRRLGGHREAEDVVQRAERQPETEQPTLAGRLRDRGVDQDEEMIRAAQAVLLQVDPDGARNGKYDVRISGGRGIVVGDQVTVTMTFND
jgi:hypothetical protein